MRRVKYNEIPQVRETIKTSQGNKCALCGGSFTDAKLVGKKLVPKLRPTLDHDHKTGFIRGVLCNNCNGMEGKIHNLANRAKRDMEVIDWLGQLLDYWNRPPSNLIHPKHKTEDEKRLARNKKARQRAAAKKAAKLLAGQ